MALVNLMDEQQDGSGCGWILAIVLIIAFGAWMAGDLAAQITMGR